MFAVSVPPIQLIMPIGICDAVHNLWQQDTESSALTSDGWSPRCRGPRNAHGSSSRSPPNFYHRVIATEIGRRQLEEIRITSQLTNPHQRQAVATTHLHHVKQCNVRVVMRLSHHVQSGASNRAKIGGAYFSDVTGSIQDPIAVPGPCELREY